MLASVRRAVRSYCGFEVPATYSEKQPSTLYRENSEFLRVSPDPRMVETWQKLDKAYFGSKSNQ